MLSGVELGALAGSKVEHWICDVLSIHQVCDSTDKEFPRIVWN